MSTEPDPASELTAEDYYYGGGADYDPEAYVPYWHQRMELITICVCNGLTLLTICARIWIRRATLKRFRADDYWMIAAGVVLIFPHWVCQIGSNLYGGGLHSQNIPDEWLEPYWKFTWGWLGYYLCISLIKVSICCCFLDILPATFIYLRRSVYALCFVIMGLGIAESLVWIFQCQPVMSNFDYMTASTWCVNVDQTRYAWVGVSILIDIAIIAIPFAIISNVRLKPYERKALILVFGSSLLGTAACFVGIYGIWLNREGQAWADLSYTATVFVMVNDVEILMYTIGASATVASKFVVSKAASMSPNSSRSSAALNMSWSRKHRFSGTANTMSASRKSTTTTHSVPVIPEEHTFSEVKPIDVTVMTTTATTALSLDDDDDPSSFRCPDKYDPQNEKWPTSAATLDLERQWEMELERHHQSCRHNSSGGGGSSRARSGSELSGYSRDKSVMSLDMLG